MARVRPSRPDTEVDMELTRLRCLSGSRPISSRMARSTPTACPDVPLPDRKVTSVPCSPVTLSAKIFSRESGMSDAFLISEICRSSSPLFFSSHEATQARQFLTFNGPHKCAIKTTAISALLPFFLAIVRNADLIR